MPAPRSTPQPRKQATPVGAPQPLLTEAEAARFLRCSIWFLRDDRRGARVVPFIKLGARAVRYRVGDVTRALDQMVLGARR